MAEELPKEVQIIDIDEVTTYPRIGEAKKQVVVTYVAPGYPPRTLFIPKEEYSEEKLKELIIEDLKRLRERKPRSLKLS